MIDEIQHDAIRELLAPYALHAVDADEAEMIEAHLETCSTCRLEVDEFRATAAMLGSAPTEAPDNLWSRIELQLGSDEPPPFELLPLNAPLAKHESATAHRIPTWGIFGGAIAASILVIALAVGALSIGDNSKPTPPINDLALAQKMLTTPNARTVQLLSGDGQKHVEAVMLPNGHGYLLNANLPTLDSGRTYQLWSVVGDKRTAVSAGVIGDKVGVTPFTATGDVKALALTEEVAGGVVSSTQTPVATGVIQSA